MWFVAQAFQQESELVLQIWQLLADDLPNQLKIHIKVSVDDALAESDDPAPRDLGMLLAELRREPVSRFTDDPQVPHH